MLNRALFSFFILLAGAVALSAQEAVRFTPVPLRDPSSQTAIRDIVQDDIGYIWFCNRYGLFRFDGFHLDSFKNNPEDEQSISFSAIRCLRRDSAGMLWIGTEIGSVDRVDPLSLSVRHFSFSDEPESQAPSGSAIADICIDSTGAVWAVREDGSLHVMRRGARAFSRFPANDAAPAIAGNWRQGSVLQVLEREPGEYWVSFRGNAPCRFNPENGAILARMKGEAASRGETYLTAAPDGSLYLAIWGSGVWRYDVGRENLQPVSGGWRRLLAAQATQVTRMLFDRSGNLWLGTAANGIFRVGPADGEPLHVRTDPSAATGLNDDTINSLYADAGGTLWVGTGAGLCTYHPAACKFLGSFTRMAAGAQESYIYSLFSDDGQRLWVGSEAQKLSLFTIPGHAGGAYEPVRLPHPLDTPVYAFLLAPGERELVVGTADRGILGIDIASGAQRAITGPQHVTSMHLNGDDLIFGTYVNGLGFRTREGTEAVLSYWKPERAGSRTIHSFDVTVIKEDSTGTNWVGTDGEGLYRVYPGERSFKGYLAHTPGRGSLSDNRILSIWIDDADILWIGTRNGLDRFDAKSERFDCYYEKDGLPDSVVCGVLGDDEGRLWLSTMRGLASFDTRTRRWQRFDTGDGLTDYAFMPGACYKGADGTLYFGSVHGFQAFNPAELPINRHVPRIVISGLTVMNQARPVPRGTSERHPLEIPWDQNLLAFEFVALDFAAVDKNTFSYRLEGHDNAWIEAGSQRVAGYSRVPPGHYRFQVRGANNDGVPSAQDAELHLFIVPPFWMTWEFQAAVIFLALAALISGYKLRINAIKRQRERLQREVDERKIAELRLLTHQARLKSLTSELTLAEERERRRIASALHDQIGHALFSTKVILSDQAQNIADETISAKLQSAIAAIDATLGHTRSLTAEISPPSLYRFGFVAAAEGLLDRLNEEHRIQGIFSVEDIRQPEEEVAILLYQSLREILHNVVKHAGATEMRVHLSGQDGFFVVMISDNGIGFNAEAVMNDAGYRGGYGLFSIQQRLESIGGRFEVRSGAGAGTTIVLMAPLDAAGEEAEIDTDHRR